VTDAISKIEFRPPTFSYEEINAKPCSAQAIKALGLTIPPSILSRADKVIIDDLRISAAREASANRQYVGARGAVGRRNVVGAEMLLGADCGKCADESGM
jgi:hypothetical protein